MYLSIYLSIYLSLYIYIRTYIHWQVVPLPIVIDGVLYSPTFWRMQLFVWPHQTLHFFSINLHESCHDRRPVQGVFT